MSSGGLNRVGSTGISVPVEPEITEHAPLRRMSRANKAAIANGAVAVAVAAAVAGTFVGLMFLQHGGSASSLMNGLDGKLLVFIGSGAVGAFAIGSAASFMYGMVQARQRRRKLSDDDFVIVQPPSKDAHKTEGYKTFDAEALIREGEQAVKKVQAFEERQRFDLMAKAIDVQTYDGMDAQTALSDSKEKIEAALNNGDLIGLNISKLWNDNKEKMTIENVREAFVTSNIAVNNDRFVNPLLSVAKLMGEYIGIRNAVKKKQNNSPVE